MGADCCGNEYPHEHEDEVLVSEPTSPFLTPPDLPAEITKTVITQGSGGYPRKGDEVRVHYTGWLESTGVKFDSSVDRGQLFSFTLGKGQVIRGWDLGVATMQVGEKAKFILPSEFAYGKSGSPPTIPGESVLIFEIELFSFGGKDLFNDGRVVYKHLIKSKDWKTPREGDEVVFELTESKDQSITQHTHSINQQTSTSGLNPELLDALLAELKLGDKVHVELNEAEAKKNPNKMSTFDLTLTAIHKVDDVSFSPGSKRIYKKTLIPGEGYQSPELQSEVTVSVQVMNSDGFILTSKDEVRFVMGEGAVCELIEAATSKMVKNEQALVWLGTNDVNAVKCGILEYPVETGLQFKITLHQFSETKPYFEKTAEEKKQLGEWLKEAGSKVLKEGKVQFAADKYKQVVKMFEFKDKDAEGVSGLVKACRLNLAMCYVKLEEWKLVKEEAGKVLEVDGVNVKALYRRALAENKVGEWVEAEKDLKKLLEVDGGNVEGKQLLGVVREEVKKQVQKEKGLFSRMFKAVGKE